MPRRRAKKNPLPKAPAKRRFAGQPPASPRQLQSSLARVRKFAGDHERAERRFDPSRAPSWRGSSRDLVVNGRYTLHGKPLDAFTKGFLETALWSSTDESDESGGEPLDKNYSIEDFDPKTVAGLSADCARFQEENADDLSVAYEQGIRGSEGDDEFSAGHDFWLTRCGHGAGFWDGDYPEPQATRLTKSSEKFGNVDLYIGDDGVIYAMGYESGARKGYRSNAEQLHFPFGSKHAGALEIRIPTFDWKQIGGDVDPGAYGGTIARADGDSIELVQIQPVREFVGDDEAKEVGFPFWTKEANFDLDDLSLSSKDVQGALSYVGLKDDPSPLEDASPEDRAVMIAEALQSYGRGDEGEGGWATDIVQFPVKWWLSDKPVTFEEFCGDEDDEFRREVLGEEEPKYTYKMTYETWDEEALEAGDTDDKGWEEEGSEEYDSLEDVLKAVDNYNWVEWSSSHPDSRSWLISEEEQDMRSGDRTTRNLWIERADGEPLSQEELKTISSKLGVRMR